MIFDLGMTPGDSLQRNNDIFSAPPEIFNRTRVTLATATASYKRGQILVQDSTTQKYSAVTTFAELKTALIAAEQMGVLLEDVEQEGTEAQAVIQTKANLIMQRIIPNDIPAGSYSYGSFIIEEETL